MSAAVLHFSPPAVNPMASRRVPLAAIPNAINSPNRNAAAVGTKRSRPQASDQRDLPCGQPPPAKRLQRETDELRRHAVLKKSGPPTALQKKLEAAKATRQSPQKATQSSQKPSEQALENFKQWQQHYRKVFPRCVFYFESVSDETRSTISRQIKSLGAREEIFFSKVVTHVITTRAIPSDDESSSSASTRSHPTNTAPQAIAGDGRTINPLLLETQQHRNKFLFDPAMLARAAQVPHAADARGRVSNDILRKAQEMKMKIWPLEKLQRILRAMFNSDSGDQAASATSARPHIGPTSTQTIKHVELSQLLQHEKMYGTADREWMSDMLPFRGCYIYVHDMDEKTRPVMMRDYPRPPSKEEGKWPQLRITGPGRCPYLDDPSYREKVAAEQKQKEETGEQPPCTRAASAVLQASKKESAVLAENKTLAKQNSIIQPARFPELAKPLDPPKAIPAKRGSTDTLPLFGSTQMSRRPQPRYAGGEPVASGVQPSNITSAIKSQMISSTAAAPGTKAGSSKELNALKRKVLEKNKVQSGHGMPTSYLNEVRAAINNDCGTATINRGIKRKAEALAHIEEETVTVTDGEQHVRVMAPVRKKQVEKEAKPGYCENCREKFDDFETHISGRKHRKFATTAENWRELDELLSHLVRPRKGTNGWM